MGGMPGPLRLIRLLRAFRVFRLFNRVESMRRVLESIMKAVPGVMDAFLINFILICIYALLSVDFFSDLYSDCAEEDFEGPAAMRTARDKCWGYDYYGHFSRSFYTMFQILTGESWSEAAARPAMNYYSEKKDMTYVVITYVFFYSFVIINSFVLLNVVVAVLMDGMNSTVTEDEPPPEEVAEGSEETDPTNGEDRSGAEQGSTSASGKASPSVPGSELTDLLQGIADIKTQLADHSRRMEDQSKRIDDIREEMKQFVYLNSHAARTLLCNVK